MRIRSIKHWNLDIFSCLFLINWFSHCQFFSQLFSSSLNLFHMTCCFYFVAMKFNCLMVAVVWIGKKEERYIRTLTEKENNEKPKWILHCCRIYTQHSPIHRNAMTTYRICHIDMWYSRSKRRTQTMSGTFVHTTHMREYNFYMWKFRVLMNYRLKQNGKNKTESKQTTYDDRGKTRERSQCICCEAVNELICVLNFNHMWLVELREFFLFVRMQKC